MAFGEYATRLTSEFAQLLDREHGEAIFHRFFEQNPSLVPGPGSGEVPLKEYAVSPAPAGEIIQPRFVLVYGRRAEFADDANLRHARAGLLGGAMRLVSYDRLSPDPNLANVITVKATGSGRFRVSAVPPTFTLGPRDADRLNIVDGICEVLAATSSISEERRRFLVSRVPYWKEWDRGCAHGMSKSGDCE